tara:strand:+ start:4398 stop:5054 length:657 start_codon:yes stop_codon:yes gene_type:complete
MPRHDYEIFQDLGWIGQYKYNDSHLLAKYTPQGPVELWNRHAEKFRTYNCPDWLQDQLQTLRQSLDLDATKTTIIDGGLLDQKHQAIKDTIVLWDILVLDDQHLINTTYDYRYDKLKAISSEETWDYKTTPLGCKITQDIFIPKNWDLTDVETIWQTVNQINAPFTTGTVNSKDYSIKPILEGIVYKDPTATLELGFKEKNNDTWMCKSRVATGRHAF